MIKKKKHAVIDFISFEENGAVSVRIAKVIEREGVLRRETQRQVPSVHRMMIPFDATNVNAILDANEQSLVQMGYGTIRAGDRQTIVEAVARHRADMADAPEFEVEEFGVDAEGKPTTVLVMRKRLKLAAGETRVDAIGFDIAGRGQMEVRFTPLLDEDGDAIDERKPRFNVAKQGLDGAILGAEAKLVRDGFSGVRSWQALRAIVAARTVSV